MARFYKQSGMWRPPNYRTLETGVTPLKPSKSNTVQPMSEPVAKNINIQRIYLKDASLETPNTPAIFTLAWEPQIDVQVNTAVAALADNHHEVVLTTTLTAKLKVENEERVAYLVEVKQAGVFGLTGFDDPEEQQAVLAAWAPTQLFPYVREQVARLIEQASFPSFLLQPINFDAVYQQHVMQQREQALKESEGVTRH